MKSSLARFLGVLCWGMMAKCLNGLIAVPLTLTQSLLMLFCHILWVMALVLLAHDVLHMFLHRNDPLEVSHEV